MSGPFAGAGVIVITACISPYRSDRAPVRSVAPDLFHEVHIKADVATCEKRDPKGLYAKARSGEIKEFTGVSAPYEAPEKPELVVDTTHSNVDESLALLSDYVLANFSVTGKV